MIGLRRALVVIAGSGFAAGFVIACVIAYSDHWGARKEVDAAIFLFIGWSFIGTGVFAWWRRPASRFGVLMTATGFTFLISGLTGAGNSAVFTAGVAVGAVFYAFLSQMLFLERQSRAERWLLAAIWFAALPLSVLVAMLAPRDVCAECPQNELSVSSDVDLFEVANDSHQILAMGLLVAAVFMLWRRWRRATAPQRRQQAAVLWSGAATFAAFFLLLGIDLVGVSDDVLEVSNYVGLGFLATIPYAFLGTVMRNRMSRAGAVEGLVEQLRDTPGPGHVRDALASALGDRSLALAYWLPESRGYVDADGRPVELPALGSGRASSHVELDGRPVAAIVHDPSLLEEPGLVRAAGAAAALALENERLEAQLRAKVSELQASRARIVQAGDEARRRLERNLHDGAQQRLVALRLALRLARDRVGQDPEAATGLLDGALEELAHALDELRELARGIHPAVLSTGGLSIALDALASRAPFPVEVDASDHRFPEPVEAAAYFVVAESLTNVAKYAQASHARVSVQRDNGRAVIEVRDDGLGGADPAAGSGLRGLGDRVAALDGQLVVVSSPGEGTVVRAEIPCAS